MYIFLRQREMTSHCKVTSWEKEPSNAADSWLARTGVDPGYGYALITEVSCSARVVAEFLLPAPSLICTRVRNLKEIRS